MCVFLKQHVTQTIYIWFVQIIDVTNIQRVAIEIDIISINKIESCAQKKSVQSI